MNFDITRVTFDPLKHFSSVQMQQGRVQVDADWNEQGAILLHHLRRMASDLFGSAGGPAANLGFGIVALAPDLVTRGPDFIIGPGRYYVDGVLCEVEWSPIGITRVSDSEVHPLPGQAWTVGGKLLMKDQYVMLFDTTKDTKAPRTVARITDIDYSKRTIKLTDVSAFWKENPAHPYLQRFVTYRSQPDFPDPPEAVSGLVYLDVWERAITCAEDDSIREVALNGPDTAARTQVVCWVKILKDVAENMTPQQLADLLEPGPRGLLRAMAKPAPAATDPCTIAPDARYRGVENQLYRVEIHTGNLSGGTPTFKWSRENGSVVFSIRSGLGTERLVLESLGRDDRFGLREGDWVEVLDNPSVLSSRVTRLLQVRAIDRSRIAVTLSGKTPADIGIDAGMRPLLRRWDQSFPDGESHLKQGADGAVQIPESGSEWLELEDGVLIQFADLPRAKYRARDHWLIAARVATGDVEWPRETVPSVPPTVEPIAQLPLGVTHRYAPLALIKVSGNEVGVTERYRFALAVSNVPSVEKKGTQWWFPT